MGEEGNLNLGLSMEGAHEVAHVEENLACSLTELFDILDEHPASPALNKGGLFESIPEIYSQNLHPKQEETTLLQSLWGPENGGQMSPQPFENLEALYGNYFPMDNFGQQDDPDNFCNETDTEQWMSNISNCDLDLNLNINVNTPQEGLVEGRFSGYQWGPEFYIQPQLQPQHNTMQFQPHMSNYSSSYYGVGGRC